MGIAAPWPGGKRFAAIGGQPEAAVGHQHFIGIGRRNSEMSVVTGAADQRALPASYIPILPAVVGSPDRALVRCLNQRVYTLAVARGNRHIDLPDRRLRHTVPFD